MSHRCGVLFVVLLTILALVVAKGGRGGGGGGRGGGSSSKGGGSSKGGSSGGSSYPKQNWSPAPAPAPPSYPSYPSRNPSPPSYPSHNPASNPGYPSAPPSYSAPGQHYPAPPSYPGSGGYPASGGYPRPPSYPSNPSYPSGPKAPKGGGGIGTHLAAGAAGAVAGAAIGSRFKGPKIRIYAPMMGYHGHGHYGYRDSSSSEEYFEPYITGPGGRYRPPARNGAQLTPEGEQIVKMTGILNNLCEKLQQPAACTMLKLQGVRPFTHPNSMFNQPEEPRPQETTHTFNLTGTNNTVVLNGTGVFLNNEPVANGTGPTVAKETKLYPDLPVGPPVPEAATEPPHLSEDRLKAADDLLKALGDR